MWEGDLRFRASSGTVETVIDGHSVAGPSPVQALAFALAGCMAIDVVDILRKGRFEIATLSAKLVATRAETNPHRFVSVELHFDVRGNATAVAMERAIQLSRDRYCSVWHSMREDIEFTTTFAVEP